MNEDYINGMKFLLKESKKQGINIRRCLWIPHVSKMLSEHNLCYKFWYNVVEQGNLYRIFLCENWYDIMYVGDKWLFYWGTTEEGNDFWKNHLWEMLGFYEKDISFGFPSKLREMKL
jgi:hypothetical protein